VAKPAVQFHWACQELAQRLRHLEPNMAITAAAFKRLAHRLAHEHKKPCKSGCW
jgi:hypothetical protein